MPRSKQIAALPIRFSRKGRIEILLVTSRDTGRWVPPKGWPMDGRKPWAAAAIEALEEAGAIGTVHSTPLGSYRYDKQMGDGTAIRCEVTLFPMVVSKLKKRWKEREQRKRHWFSVTKAAASVDEKDLRALILALGDGVPLPKKLLKAG